MRSTSGGMVDAVAWPGMGGTGTTPVVAAPGTAPAAPALRLS
jgi:hypothetical protein